MASHFSRFRERIQKQGLVSKAPLNIKLGTFRMFSNGVLTSSQVVHPTGITPSVYIERTWDQNNIDTQKGGRRAGSRVFRTGGPFVNIKTRVDGMNPIGFGKYSSKGNPNFGDPTKNWWEYEGSFMNPDLSFDGITALQYNTAGGASFVGNPLVPDMTPYESQAWNSTKPKLEKSGLANFLYEFKDVPQQLHISAKAFHDIWRGLGGDVKSIDLRPNRLADDFLNIEFGWMPFVSDIVKLCDAVIFSKQYLDEISHGNSVWLKRRATLSDVNNVSRLTRQYSYGSEPVGTNIDGICKDMTLDGHTCKGYMDLYAVDKTVVWSEGAFKYYRPEFDETLPYYGSVTSEVNRHITMLGLRISPSHIYKAIPWTWAIDWFTNVGDLIQRHQDEELDGMVSKYLYLMHHRVRTLRSFHLYNFWSGAKAVEFERFVETKQRRNADSPYGFVLGKDLSPTQWAIIGALGLTRNVSFARS